MWLYETAVQQSPGFNSLQNPGTAFGLREVIFAARTDALILRELDLVHDFGAAGTLLPKALWHLALLAALRFERGFFEDGHVLCAGSGRSVHRGRAGCFQHAGALAQRGTGGQYIVDQQHAQVSHGDLFS